MKRLRLGCVLLLSLTAASSCSSCEPPVVVPEPDHWTAVGPLDRPIYALVHDSFGRLYAGTNEADVFRSPDNGDNWENIGIEAFCNTATRVTALEVGGFGRLIAGTDNCGILVYDPSTKWHTSTGVPSNVKVFDLAAISWSTWPRTGR